MCDIPLFSPVDWFLTHSKSGEPILNDETQLDIDFLNFHIISWDLTGDSLQSI